MGVRYSAQNAIATIVIDRPEARNAMDQAAYTQLAGYWRRIRDDGSIRVAVITGVGQSFCAGADLKTLIPALTGQQVPFADPEASRNYDNAVAVLRNFTLHKPIVAAVNGFCVASGMELLLGTDIRIASENASFGLPEVSRGLVAVGGSTVRLPRQIPFVHAMDILLTGRRLGAQEALRIGLINCVVPYEQLMTKAMEYAEQIAANSPHAVMATKESAMMGLRVNQDEAYDFEWAVRARAFTHPDAVEGPRAFFEKRAARWAPAERVPQAD
jgi:enoyl-CoA hydratase